MYGKNEIHKSNYNGGDVYWVQEVFYTIQGEGPDAGTPAVFIRLAGCNLRCWFCDTDFESSAWEPTRRGLIDRVLEVASNATQLVVLTGGEPMRQDIVPLLHDLVYTLGFTVQIETAGTLWPPGMTELVEVVGGSISIVVSPKTAKVHKQVAKYAKAWKYIIRHGCTDDADGLPVMATATGAKTVRLARPRGGARVFVQPMDEKDNWFTKRNTDEAVRVAMEHGYRLSLQIHKYIGVD